ncbi:MAG: phage adaptor protein, partial [Gaiellaceae bacterium]
GEPMAFPATFKDLQDQVIAKARLDATADRPKTKDWINRVYARIAVETEALQTSAMMVVTPNVASYTISTSILRIKSMTSAPPGGGYGPPLEEVSLDQIEIWRQTGTTSPVANEALSQHAQGDKRDRCSGSQHADAPPDAAQVVVPAESAVDRESPGAGCSNRNRDGEQGQVELEAAIPVEEPVRPVNGADGRDHHRRDAEGG